MYEWDKYNLRKLASHNVRPEEAIEALENNPMELEYQDHGGEFRYPVIGETKSGRILYVLWTDHGNKVRILNAYDASPRQRRLYRNL